MMKPENLKSPKKVYETLTRCYYIVDEAKGELFPMHSPYHTNGVIIPIFTDKDEAVSRAIEQSEHYGLNGTVKTITSLWDLIIDCSHKGFAGLMVNCEFPIHFMNRVGEVNRTKPTVAQFKVLEKTEHGHTTTKLRLYFGVRGLVKVDEHGLIEWSNFRAFDATSRKWMLGNNPLPESVNPFTIVSDKPDHVTVNQKEDIVDYLHRSYDGATLLGPYVSDQGAIPIFSSKAWCDYFGLTKGLFEVKDGEVSSDLNFHSEPIDGIITDFLEAIYKKHHQFVDIGLNPTCHRFRQGYFFKKEPDWYLRTIGGTFRINGNSIERADETPLPKHDDDVDGRVSDYWLVKGLKTTVRYPFKRILGSSSSLVPSAEADEIVFDEIDRKKDDDYKPPHVEKISVDSYLIKGFDKISGDNLSFLFGEDGGDEPLVFPDFIKACKFLLDKFLDLDEEVRINGAKVCHGPFIPGSNNQKAEKKRSAAFVQAIKALIKASMEEGYRPEFSWHLKRLFQDVSRVLEITLAGYVSDLLSYDDDFTEMVKSDMDESSIMERIHAISPKAKAKSFLDPNTVQEVRKHLGTKTEDLFEGSLDILCAAIEELNQIGMKPNYDYAGVNMKLCKTFEREIKNKLFDEWVAKVRSEIGKEGIKKIKVECEKNAFDQTGYAALEVLEKKGRLELGKMRYLLKAVRDDSKHPAIQFLSVYLRTFEKFDWLVSDEMDNILSKISSRYRNGGVHEHIIDFRLCQEAFAFLLTGKNAALPKLLEALPNP